MKGLLLRGTLAVTGGLFCLAGLGLLFPESGLKAAGGWLVGAEAVHKAWPAAPLFGYTLRTSLVAYLWIGVVLLLAAWDPVRHRVQIDVAMVGLFLMAVVCFVAGVANGIPAMWYLGDSLLSLLAAGLLFAFRPRKTKA